MSSFYNLLYKYQPYLLGAGIFFFMSSIAFQYDGDKEMLEFVFDRWPVVTAFFVVIGLLVMMLYIHLDKKRLQGYSNQLKRAESRGFNAFDQLTQRQQEVYQLIMQGMSNKEICSKLYIEPSTLKTHINQLYKKMKVANRKELKSLDNI